MSEGLTFTEIFLLLFKEDTGIHNKGLENKRSFGKVFLRFKCLLFRF